MVPMREDWWVMPVLWVVGLGLLAGILVDVSGWLAVTGVCGSAPRFTWSAAATWALSHTSTPAAFGGPAGCVVPAAAVWAWLAGLVGLALALTVAAGVGYRTWKHSDTALVWELLSRDGLARRREVTRRFGERQLVKRAGFFRPSIAHPVPADVGFLAGIARGIPVWFDAESSIAVDGPPRTFKTRFIITPAILGWRGPVVATLTRSDVIHGTIQARTAMGRVTVFDPENLSGIRSTARISPIPGCEKITTARQRAGMLVAGSALGQSQNNQEFAGFATDYLAAILHAAALDERTMADVAVWGVDAIAAKPVVAILRSHGVTLLADMLDALINSDARERSVRWFGVAGALAPLDGPGARGRDEPASWRRRIRHCRIPLGREHTVSDRVGRDDGSGRRVPRPTAEQHLRRGRQNRRAFEKLAHRLAPRVHLGRDFQHFRMAGTSRLHVPCRRCRHLVDGCPAIHVPNGGRVGRPESGRALVQRDRSRVAWRAGRRLAHGRHGEDHRHPAPAKQHPHHHDGRASRTHAHADVDVITASEINRIPNAWALVKSKNARAMLVQLLPKTARLRQKEAGRGTPPTVRAAVAVFGE